MFSEGRAHSPRFVCPSVRPKSFLQNPWIKLLEWTPMYFSQFFQFDALSWKMKLIAKFQFLLIYHSVFVEISWNFMVILNCFLKVSPCALVFSSKRFLFVFFFFFFQFDALSWKEGASGKIPIFTYLVLLKFHETSYIVILLIKIFTMFTCLYIDAKLCYRKRVLNVFYST